MPSPFQVHCDKWKNGCGGPDCGTAKHVVLCRGQLPCDVLFVGEAPGETEDVHGVPFVGPAGYLLDGIILRSIGQHNMGLPAGVRHLRYALTNLVGCIPRDGAYKASEPAVESIMNCAPRLQELIYMGNPKLIVCVGDMARDWLRKGFQNPVTIPPSITTIHITHPAAMLRMNVAQRGYVAQRAAVTITTAIEDLMS